MQDHKLHGATPGKVTPINGETAGTATSATASKTLTTQSNFIAARALLTRAKGLISATALIDLMIFAQAAQLAIVLLALVLGDAQ